MLVPLLVGVAERCDGFDFDVAAFDAVYGAVERGVTAAETRVSAFTPLAGLLLSNPPADLGAGVTVRRASLGEIGARWPEASGLVPDGFGREPDQLLYLDLELSVRKGEPHRDAAELVGQMVTALRLATGACVAAGPLLFEAVDGAHRSVRALPPLAAATPHGNAVRLDANSLATARALAAALAAPAPVRLELALGAARGRRRRIERRYRASCLEPLRSCARCSTASASATTPSRCASRRCEARRRVSACASSSASRMRQPCYRRTSSFHPRSCELLEDEIDGAARATLLAALLDGRANEDLGDELDGVLLGARPRPRSVPDGLPGLVAKHVA